MDFTEKTEPVKFMQAVREISGSEVGVGEVFGRLVGEKREEHVRK